MQARRPEWGWRGRSVPSRAPRWPSGLSGATMVRGPGCATAPASAGASCRDRARPTPRRGEGEHERLPRRGGGATAVHPIRRGHAALGGTMTADRGLSPI